KSVGISPDRAQTQLRRNLVLLVWWSIQRSWAQTVPTSQSSGCRSAARGQWRINSRKLLVPRSGVAPYLGCLQADPEQALGQRHRARHAVEDRHAVFLR